MQNPSLACREVILFQAPGRTNLSWNNLPFAEEMEGSGASSSGKGSGDAWLLCNTFSALAGRKGYIVPYPRQN